MSSVYLSSGLLGSYIHVGFRSHLHLQETTKYHSSSHIYCIIKNHQKIKQPANIIAGQIKFIYRWPNWSQRNCVFLLLSVDKLWGRHHGKGRPSAFEHEEYRVNWVAREISLLSHIVILSPSCVMTTFIFRFSCIYFFSLRQYLWAESGEELPSALLRPLLPGSPPLQGRRETGLSWPPEPIVIKPFHPNEGAWAGTKTVLSSCSINLPHLP